MKSKGPKILALDIETSPILARVWGLFDQNIALNQMEADSAVISWSAKWLGQSRIMYKDLRGKKDLSNNKEMLKGIHELLESADIVLTHNGKRFDIPRLNAAFVEAGMQPPSSFKHIDTCLLARKYFGFTSNKLEHLARTLKCKHQKSSHKKFVGFEMWKECLKDNKAAWKEMEKYNKIDVLVLEEVYKKLAAWDSSINFAVYGAGKNLTCKCGSKSFIKRGFFFTNVGKYQRYKCNACGNETRDRTNVLPASAKKALRTGTVR